MINRDMTYLISIFFCASIFRIMLTLMGGYVVAICLSSGKRCETYNVSECLREIKGYIETFSFGQMLQI